MNKTTDTKRTGGWIVTYARRGRCVTTVVTTPGGEAIELIGRTSKRAAIAQVAGMVGR